MTTPFRFLHSADLHLGRRFGAMPEGVRGRLIEARHGILARLAATARAHGAADILLAGDTFDTETPSDATWRQALTAMAAEGGLRWWVLPGNHDSLAAEPLWARFAAQAPDSVRVITQAAPIDLAPGVMLLPAPLPRRRPGRDLTDWMAGAATPEGALRLGLAHGAVHDFSEEGSAGDGTIPPDRAETAGLAYLALGDWHGQMRLSPRAAYAGTPEADGFRHAGRGACLAVTLTGPTTAQAERVETGQFHWAEVEMPLVPGQDGAATLETLLPAETARRRDHLLRLRATGRATLHDHQALADAAEAVAPDFAHFALDTTALVTEVEDSDLDSLDHAGALRHAADLLAQDTRDPALAEADRQIAAGALTRLFAYLREAS
jgi:DNA repair exonuclease SbcCD nuclease subunit